MDYLDTNKERRHNALLLVGYVLIAVAITISALVLLYQAYGFGIDKNGAVVQNGLTFFSSHPHPADIYVNDKLQPVKTNTRLVLPSGMYNVKLAREGYNDWQRKIELDGGSVEHFDYPFLYPRSLVTKKIQTYDDQPGMVTQSPDHRWLLVQQGNDASFLTYDLKNITAPAQMVTLPATVASKPAASETWELEEWADDNDHVLLLHNYDGKSEYILVDRTNPGQSLNLNTQFATNPTKITLIDKKYDKYYLYNQADGGLSKVSLRDKQPTPMLQHVLAYKSYSDDTILFVTDNGAPKGMVRVRMVVGDKTWTVRNLTAGTDYVVDLTGYDGSLYVAAGAASDNRVYIYKDPVGQLSQENLKIAVPIQVLHVEQVNYLSFSASAQFIVAENGNRFGVYDIENETGYNYATAEPVDTPQAHASWMDGNRLVYVSGGKLFAYDFDNTNSRSLMPSGSAYLPAFDRDYKYVYALAPNAAGQWELNQTALLAPNDL
jgi:hypothetical protein